MGGPVLLLGDVMDAHEGEVVAGKIQVFTFHRTLECSHCGAVHRPGEATHIVASDEGLYLICNRCHALGAEWKYAYGW